MSSGWTTRYVVLSDEPLIIRDTWADYPTGDIMPRPGFVCLLCGMWYAALRKTCGDWSYHSAPRPCRGETRRETRKEVLARFDLVQDPIMEVLRKKC